MYTLTLHITNESNRKSIIKNLCSNQIRQGLKLFFLWKKRMQYM